MTRRILVALLATLATAPLAAQWNAARYGRNEHRLYVTVGLDPAVVTAVGYGHTQTILGRPTQVGLEAGVAGGGFDVRDFRVRLGGDVALLRWRDVQLTGRLAFVTRGTRNTIYRAVSMGADAGGTLGVYRQGWFAAGEVRFDKAIITHLSHTTWYRRNIYPDAKDGWYLTTGGTWEFGGVTGVTLGRTEVSLRAGIPRTQGGRHLVTPVYASLGVGVGF